MNQTLACAFVAIAALAGCQSVPPKAPALAAGAKYVAMGSSFAAGPGIPTYVDTPPTPCARSDGNYAHQLAKRMNLALVDVGCSGGTTRHLLGPRDSIPPQLDALTADTKLVTITIGGNDINYLGRLSAASCVGLASESGVAAKCGAIPPMPTEQDYADLRTRMDQIVAEVRKRSPSARLVFVDYFTILPAGALCRAAPLSEAEAAKARQLATRLADITAKTATAGKTDLIRASALSAHHDACAADPWINGYPRPDAPIAGTAYHPNKPDMTAVADALEKLLR
ncbi:MAG: SGNH/GDSL hydrolase family protein [Alphaproteobacteria bacterium]